MPSPRPAITEAELLLAFERLCRSCKHLLPHPLYHAGMTTEEGHQLKWIEEALDEGPMCKAGLAPLTRDGSDCPYFRRGGE